MKKLLSIVITTILLFSCWGLMAFANPSSATLSDDYQKLYIGENTYSRFRPSMVEINYFDSNIPVELNASQQETIDKVSLQANEGNIFIYVQIYFKDGAILSVEFLRDDYADKYNEISAGETDTYTIDFEYPEGNLVTADKSALFGERVTLTREKLEWCSYYPIFIQSSDKALTSYKGSLIVIEEDYYYVDYDDIEIEDRYYFDPYEYETLPAHQILDDKLIADIQEAEEAFYSDDFGFLLDDDLSKSISAVFLVIVFAIIPFAIFVVFLILAIRSKTVYKKMFRFIYILSAAELVVFAIVASFVMMGR